jgi:hypothetical protein
MNIQYVIDCQHQSAFLYKMARVNMEVDPERSKRFQKAAAYESSCARRHMDIE